MQSDGWRGRAFLWESTILPTSGRSVALRSRLTCVYIVPSLHCVSFWLLFLAHASGSVSCAVLCYNNAMAESPLTVLIVDDEENHADVIAASLEKLGVACQVAYTEPEALAKIKEQYFDVIITDLMLERPDSGIEILKAVKAESNETEVILITANNSVEIAVEAMRLGAFNYLQKPLDLKQLRTIARLANMATIVGCSIHPFDNRNFVGCQPIEFVNQRVDFGFR